MTLYYNFMGWAAYSSTEAWDHQPYPEEWLLEQQH
jgi:hypothetical protein